MCWLALRKSTMPATSSNSGNFHGRVARASTAEGVILQTASGEEIWLPPDFDSYHPADPGEYRLRSTGEVVVNPDYTATWTVWPPDRH